MATTRREVADLIAAAINESRRGRTNGLHARAWSGTGSDRPPVRVYIDDHRTKKRKRMGRVLDVEEKKPLGHIELSSDGRLWLNRLMGKVGKIGRLVEKQANGILITDDGTGEEVAIVVMKPRTRMDDQ